MRKLNVLVYNDISEKLVKWLESKYEVKIYKYGEQDQASYFNKVDLVILNGEETGNIHPDYYSENVGKHTNVVNGQWNKYDSLYYSAESMGVPVLGIEEGGHYLTVKSGGKLIQYATVQSSSRTIEFSNTSRLNNMTVAKSSNTQLMYPYELPSKKYEIIAWNRYFQSDTYLNGKNQEISLPNNFLEIELVSFDNSSVKGLAVQSNPVNYNESGKAKLLSIINSFLKK